MMQRRLRMHHCALASMLHPMYGTMRCRPAWTLVSERTRGLSHLRCRPWVGRTVLLRMLVQVTVSLALLGGSVNSRTGYVQCI